MKTKRVSKLAPKGVGLALLVVLASFFPTDLSAGTAPSTRSNFIGRAADTTTWVHDSIPYSGVNHLIGAYDKHQKAFLDALDIATGKGPVTQIGQYAKVLDYGLKVIKFGDLGVQGIHALYTGDRLAFREAFNNAMREAVKTGAGMAGASVVGWAGTKAGKWKGGVLTLPAGGWGAVPMGAAGGFAGSWLGDLIFSGGAGWVYNRWLEDYVKHDLADLVFDTFSSEMQDGTGPLVPPPVMPPVYPPGPSPGPSGGGTGGGLNPFR